MIFVVHPRRLEMLPPLISLLRILKDLQEDVTYIGFFETEETSKILREIQIPFRCYPYRLVTFRQAKWLRLWQKATARIRPYLKRRWLWETLHTLGFDVNHDVVWSVEMEGTAIIGDAALKLGRRHVHTFYELGDKHGEHYRGFDVNRFCHEATLVQCEYNRAHIFKAERGIERLPFVIPNKPYAHPRKRNIPISDDAVRKIVESWKGKKVILYQGGVQDDRGALITLIENLCRVFPSLIIAVMGRKTNAVDRLLATYSNFSYVPFVLPPHHLEVTSHAVIGLAFYEGGSVYGLSPLNPVYCAPNKIYEYTGFGIPLLCNDIPGLYYTIGASGAGECLSKFDENTVENACRRILDDYEKYEKSAMSFFDAINLKQLISDILKYSRGERP